MGATKEFAASICFLFAAVVCVVGQGDGPLIGAVRDGNGVTVAGAVIVFTNQVTSDVKSIRTGANGTYSIKLPPGAYRVTVQAPYSARFDKEKNYGEFAIPRDQALENLIVEPGKSTTLEIVVEKQKLEPPAAVPVEKPTGHAGKNSVASQPQTQPDRREARDRWRLGFPEYDRYGDRGGRGRDIPFTKGRWWDPYNQASSKATTPFTATSCSWCFQRPARPPLNSGARPRLLTSAPMNRQSAEFFGQPEQLAASETIQLSFELFHGDTVFKPRDWAIKISPTFSVPNYLNARENGVVNIDVRRGTNRTDTHVSLEEAFAEVKLADLSRNYDFISLRAGIQPFVSDFRGFIFSDNNLGARLFGSFDNNRYQFNAAYFSMLEKDTNSGLNTFDTRHQNVYIANLFRQDFIRKGYTIQASFHFNDDRPSIEFDQNDFLVRPALVGDVRPHACQSRLRWYQRRWPPRSS